MPVFDLSRLIHVFARVAISISVIAFEQSFVGYLLSFIPRFDIVGCAGYYASIFGLIDALSLFVSLLVYGYTYKFVRRLLISI